MSRASTISLGLISAILLLTLSALATGTGREVDKSVERPYEAKSSPHPAETTDEYGLRPEIRGDRSLDRTFVDGEVEKVATLSEGEEYTLFTPVVAALPKDERLYVFDYGDYTVKSFTLQGQYVATYGRGKGRAPGEMMSMMDVGMWQDSLVYIVDSRQRRTSFFDKDGGDFVRTESYDMRIPRYRLAWAEGSVKYSMPNARPGLPFLIIETPERELSVSHFSSGDADPITFQAWLHTYQQKAIAVPDYYPVLLSYSPDDTTGGAYPTPDYGEDRPKAEKTDSGFRAPSWRFNQRSTLSEGMLSVGIPDEEENKLLFDLYDAQDVEYLHTLRLPIVREERIESKRALYAHGLDLVASVKDTTVEIHKVNVPEQ